MVLIRRAALLLGSLVLISSFAVATEAQQLPARKEFPPGAVRQLEDLPLGKFRDQLERLPVQARERAVAWLGNFHFTPQDLDHLQVDPEGGIFYADDFTPELGPMVEAVEPAVSEASVPVTPFSGALVFHSKPGAPNVIYLNFTGETVTGTAWNNSLNRTSIPAVAFSIDSDFATFSDAEQTAIRRIWQRIAEDYAPFNVDVTTERPATFNSRTAHALITRNTDANGNDNPASNAGGVAYVGVFGSASYGSYRPAWIYYNNLASEESYIAEAASHEVGHNLGLSHDGRTDGSEYYGGHGSGDISWGPLMGTGYNRHVSQWSKGEYYLASNTQDDLATIAGKLSYRTDDHGNTLASATPLTITSGGAVSATTPADDPNNSSPQNKGVLERNTDTDYFSFASGNGPVNLTLNPWVTASALTRGGNLDILVELYDASGRLLLTNNSGTRTFALVQTNLTEGVYYLAVRNSGAGTPNLSSSSGYSAYGSIGQYFISGTLVPSGVVIPPGAEVQVAGVSEPGRGPLQFTVTYSDNAAIDVSTLGNDDIFVTGPNGFSRAASFVGVDNLSNGSPRTATYSIAPPAAQWLPSDNGTYSISILPDSVSDTEGAFVPTRELGQFNVSVPNAVYFASMETNPGWTFQGLWEYGAPRYTSGGPISGFSGPNIIGYNLGGFYENRLPAVYATTPPIDCSGYTSLTLRFKRWLRLKNGDTANIQVSVNGIDWTSVWMTTKPVSDNAWQEVQYSLPASAAGSSSLRLRWGMASGPSQNEIGWNIDDVTILGGGTLDTQPPAATIDVPNIVAAGSPLHSFTVTYTDNVAVRVSSLGAGDLYVLGPNGYSNIVEFAGVDILSDGTPRTATYTLSAPNGAWTSAHNGSYQVYLQDAQVSDTANNPLDEALLGSFSVAIPETQQALVVEPITLSVQEGGSANFSVRLAEQPTANVSVTLHHLSGDADIVLASSSPIVFTSGNWAIPVPVTVTALPDTDQQNGTASIECRSEGLFSVSVSITENDITPAPNEPPVVALSAPLNASTFLSSDNISFAATASDDSSITKVEFFANGILVGSDSAAPFEISATLVPGTYTVMAKATDNEGASTESSQVNITVRLPNQPPSISLSAPAADSTFLTTDEITFGANATDDRSVTRVEFFANDLPLGSVTSAPYTVTATLSIGTYSITAKATDDEGAISISTAVNIRVQAPNRAPTIVLTAPSEGEIFLSTDSIAITAEAQDDAAVTKVEFFANDTLIGTDNSKPYSTASSLLAGSYSITARATDEQGLATTSVPVNISVRSLNKLPTITITSPVEGAIFNTSDTVAIRATATDEDGVISKVEFYVDGSYLRTDGVAPFTANATALAPGNHTIKATATDNAGGAATQELTISVLAPNTAPAVSLSSDGAAHLLLAPASITLKAAASDPDGTITKVEFFNGSLSLGTATTTPFELALANLGAGNYSFTAIATDDRGSTSSSSSIQVSVVQQPRISTIAPGTSCTITASATPGITYVLQGSVDFLKWIPLSTNTPSASEVIFSAPATEASQFFRIVLP